jgi:hypothetical protein
MPARGEAKKLSRIINPARTSGLRFGRARARRQTKSPESEKCVRPKPRVKWRQFDPSQAKSIT